MIQQNTFISIGKDPKYVRGTTGKIVKQIIFRKYLERTINKEDIEKRSLDEKLLEQYLELENKRRKTDNRRKTYRRMSQISESEIEDIMIEIQRMNLNDIKDVNLIGHVGGPSKIKEEHPNTFEKQYKIPKYGPRETKIEQLGNIGVYLDIDSNDPTQPCRYCLLRA